MKQNQASIERIARVGVGAALWWTGYALVGEHPYAAVGLVAVGLVAVTTGVIGYCPAWHALGISTRSKAREEGAQ